MSRLTFERLTFAIKLSLDSILYRRAVRLRRLTGNNDLKSEGEREAEHMNLGAVAQMTIVRPFVLSFTEPIIACWNFYIALVYGENAPMI
jgi:DHA1 family multidrug resistance protein-like MFS transporter